MNAVTMSICPSCLQVKEFYKCSSKKHQTYCKDCSSIRAKAYKQKVKKTVINHYGGVCFCCSEDKVEFLSIDHVNGGGLIHRKSINKFGGQFYRWLIKNEYPDGYRVACHNCNQSLGLYGYCPHQGKP